VAKNLAVQNILKEELKRYLIAGEPSPNPDLSNHITFSPF
jgi:hypothetical protein